MWSEEPCRVLLMNTPLLVGDLRLTLEKIYTPVQLKELDNALAGCGIDMEASKHLEIIPEADISERVKSLALDMSGLIVLPWCLLVDEAAVIRSCFYRVKVFQDWYYFTASFYHPNETQIHITANGLSRGGDCL